MLARLNQIDGVQSSSANESGTLIRLSLRPGADPKRVTAGARRVLSKQVEDRVPVPLGGKEATAALQTEKWRDKTWVAASIESTTTAMPTSAHRASAALPALLLGCIAIGLGLFWWWHRRRLASQEKGAEGVAKSLRRLNLT